jgi:alpha-glucosidase
MRAVIDEFPHRVLIGEIYLPVAQLMSYYGRDLKGANLPFNFHLLQCAWTAEAVKQVISDYHAALPKGAWPNWVLGNHDNARIATRVGKSQAPVAAMLLFTLPGTLTMYYGEEIGMTNVSIPPEQVEDPAEKNEPGLGLGRDPERTPMPWNASPLAGFTTGRPWLPIGDHEAVNVATLEHDPASILQLYRNLINLRRSNLTLVSGTLQSITVEQNMLCYQRIDDKQRIMVLLNIGSDPKTMSVETGTILASTYLDRVGQEVSGLIDMRASEGLIIRLKTSGGDRLTGSEGRFTS